MTSGFVASAEGLSGPAMATKTSSTSIICLAFLCSILMGAVLAFGAVEMWATSVLEVSAVLLLGGWAICQGQSIGQRLKWNPLYPPMLVFGVLVWTQIALNTTVYRYATLLTGLQYVAFAALMILAVQVTGDKGSSRIFLLASGLFGFAVAIFAICQSLSAPGKLYFVQTPSSGSAVFGPYVNHNHYAGLMEMLTPLALALSLSKLVRGTPRMLAAFAAILMAASIVLSGSRSGTFSLIVELALLFWITSQVRRRIRSRWALPLVVCCLLGFVAWIGSADLWRHFGDLQDATRPAILKDGLRMFRLKPIFGWGLGTFPIAYPAFRSFYTDLFVNAAHDDYLQALVETSRFEADYALDPSLGRCFEGGCSHRLHGTSGTQCIRLQPADSCKCCSFFRLSRSFDEFFGKRARRTIRSQIGHFVQDSAVS